MEIVVFLKPLMEDMEKQWREGVWMRDQYRQEEFTLYAMIFMAVVDGPRSFMVSGHIKGKTGCVVCLEGTAYKYLRASTKLVYMHHRRFLNKTNRLQKMKHLFDSTEDHDTAPQPLKGTHVFEW